MKETPSVVKMDVTNVLAHLAKSLVQRIHAVVDQLFQILALTKAKHTSMETFSVVKMDVTNVLALLERLLVQQNHADQTLALTLDQTLALMDITPDLTLAQTLALMDITLALMDITQDQTLVLTLDQTLAQMDITLALTQDQTLALTQDITQDQPLALTPDTPLEDQTQVLLVNLPAIVNPNIFVLRNHVQINKVLVV
jgi:hypothetical protein